MSYDSPPSNELSHPDALIRVASAVHRFRCPQMYSKKLSYKSAFQSASSKHPNTRELMSKTDSARESVLDAMAGTRSDSTNALRDVPISYESVGSAIQSYIPKVNRVMLSCKVQPDSARLDERLVFEWSSGMEAPVFPEGHKPRRGELAKPRKVTSEALMYELVMSVATEGMACIGMACDESTNGDFPASSRKFKQAAGVFECLAQDLVPKWMARGSSVDVKDLPCEATAGVAEGLKLVCLACAQQMAVATVLIKPGTPNYALLAKLCLGIAEQLEDAVNTFQNKAKDQMPKLDQGLFTLVEFQSLLQRALYLYFLARAKYDDESEYGIGIALLREASSKLQPRDTRHHPHGLPATDKRSSLAMLDADVTAVRTHFQKVLTAWEKDNSTIYFDKVPQPTAPETVKLTHGMSMMKAVGYDTLDGDVEPVPLTLPSGGGGGATASGGSGSGGSGGPPSAFQAPPPPQSHYAREPQPYASVPPPPPVPPHTGGGGGASAPPPYWSIPPPPPEPQYAVPPPQQYGGRPPVQRSDSDLARELQRRLNAGEDL